MCPLLLTCYKQSAINYKHQLNTSNNYKVLKCYKNHINQNSVCPHDNTGLLFLYRILPYTSSWALFMLCGEWFYNTWELWWRYDFYNELVNIYVLFSHFFAITTVTELCSLLGASNFDCLCRCIVSCSADDDVNFSF